MISGLSLINRIGSSRQAEVLTVTIHTVNASLPDACLIKVVATVDKKLKVQTKYEQFDPSFPVTTFDHTQALKVNFLKKKLRTLRKTLRLTLVTLYDVKEVVEGEATIDVQELSVGGPGLVRSLIPLTKCPDPQGSVCLSVARSLAQEQSPEQT